MYIIRALKVNTDEFVDIGKFRSNKKAKETIIKIARELDDNLPDGDAIRIFMGIHQFTHYPKKGSPIIYYITID